jgi:hypothetical protein
MVFPRLQFSRKVYQEESCPLIPTKVQSTNGFGAASYATVPWDTISRVPIDSNAYWSGRFMGKMTKFQDEELQLNLKRISLSYR